MSEATRFEAFKDADGKFRWRLLDAEGKIVPAKIGRIAGLRPSKADAEIEHAVDLALGRLARTSGAVSG